MKRSRKTFSACVAASIFLALTVVSHAQQPTPQKTVYQPLGPIIGGVISRQPNTPISDPESAETVADWPYATISGSIGKGDPAGTGLDIILIRQDSGEFKWRHVPAAQSDFSFNNLQPGAYSLFIQDGKETSVFQKNLLAGMHWNLADDLLPPAFKKPRPSPPKDSMIFGSSSVPPSIGQCNSAALIEVLSPSSPAKPDATQNQDSFMEVRLITAVRGAFPEKKFTIRHPGYADQFKSLKPGKHILIFTLDLDGKAPKVYQFLENDEHPDQLERLADWCRQYSRAADAAAPSPSEIVEILLSGIESPASESMATDILVRLVREIEHLRDNDPEETGSQTDEAQPPVNPCNSLYQVAKWGSKRPSILSEVQKNRLLAVLRRNLPDQALPEELLEIVTALNGPGLGEFLLERIETVPGSPSKTNLVDLENLEDILDEENASRLQRLWREVFSESDATADPEEVQTAKLALFRARRLAASVAMKKN